MQVDRGFESHPFRTVFFPTRKVGILLERWLSWFKAPVSKTGVFERAPRVQIPPSPHMKKLWFKAKTYGYGWYPATWQGWLIISIYIAVLALLITIFNTNPSEFLSVYLFLVLLTTAILIYVCYKTGEPAKWRWGDKNK